MEGRWGAWVGGGGRRGCVTGEVIDEFRRGVGRRWGTVACAAEEGAASEFRREVGGRGEAEGAAGGRREWGARPSCPFRIS